MNDSAGSNPEFEANDPEGRVVRGTRGRLHFVLITLVGTALCLFTLAEVNLNWMQPLAGMALFAMLGLSACFVDLAFVGETPVGGRASRSVSAGRILHFLLLAATVFVFGYVILQTEPLGKQFWPGGQSLGNRIAQETNTDFLVGVLGLLLVLYAAGRTIGWIVPGLALVLCAHSLYCLASSRYGWPELPSWMLPHRGQSLRDLVSTTFLQSQGVLGQAMGVMFRYVFLFIVFGAVLEMSGATQFIIGFSERLFGRTRGGPAKMAVVASGMMGSLSGSAVANAVTTGAFTIPMMKNDGFEPHDAAAVEAAAGSGGALVPPVMGAGAYMMLEYIRPAVSFSDVARAAVIPAVIYYFSLFMSVHFYSRRLPLKSQSAAGRTTVAGQGMLYEGVVFFAALAFLVGLLLQGTTPFRAVTVATVAILLMCIWRPALPLGISARLLASGLFGLIVAGHQWYTRTQTDFFALAAGPERQAEAVVNSAMLGMSGLIVFAMLHPVWRDAMFETLRKSVRNGIPLISAAACVGIIIAVVQQSGIANDFSSVMRGIVSHSLLLALLGIMTSSIILGMGVPSVVCYLLIATIMGSLLEKLGVPSLAAHMFIFYFGMMSMVTPPVALAAYAASSIAGANPMRASWSAFRFALVGFTLPFMFVYRPELLLITAEGKPLAWGDTPGLVMDVVAALVGVMGLAAALQGWFRNELQWGQRAVLAIASLLLITPSIGGPVIGIAMNAVGVLLMLAVFATNGSRRKNGPTA